MKKSELKQLIKSVLNETISEEARMAASDLDSILHHANEIKEHELVTDEAELEDWVKAKLTIANQNLISVFNYLSHEKGNVERNEKDDGLDEGLSNIDYSRVTKLFRNNKGGEVTLDDIEGVLGLQNVNIDTVIDMIDDIAAEEGFSFKSPNGPYVYGNVNEVSKEKWIQKAINPSKKGALKKALGVAADQKIPVSKLAAAAKKGGKLGQRARLAQTLRKLK
jgi:hypothetical protein